ncbi:hypothetical protein I316_06141 [Kwoniella heveanensis BCC8398]|uniref:Major facilitator superfamily (MFS) profile domain-containing protein n=1 Tax=Kwoniella heveanensis BCC8398 TaxID=1296120 RepID=A0A1B9GMK4_9TREE|nr:hypothetical protein I316_06141 [Kwoniella heveanensis BCC8398]
MSGKDERVLAPGDAPTDNAVTPTLAREAGAGAANAVDEGNYHRDDKSASDVDGSLEDGKSGLIEEKSKGVVEMESLQGRLNVKILAVLYGCFMLLAYCLSLNQYTSSYFLNYAVSYSFGKHSLQATIGTITSVFQAMSQPPIAKFADVFGRVNAYVGCVIFYVVGYIIVASSNSITTYAVGNSIYILGISGLFLLQNIIISDISSLRNRYWWTFFPSIPGAINAFVAAYVVDSFLGHGDQTKQWRWGFGIFIILTPVLATPITLVLWRYTRPTRLLRQEQKAAKAAKVRLPFADRFWIGTKAFFWQLDFIGLVLFTLGFGLFFVTITLANSRTARWSDAHSIAQLVVGFVLICGFVVWERFYAPHPLLPFALLRRKTVIGCTLIALFHPMAGRIVGGYLTTFFQVAAEQSIISTSRLTSFPTIAGTVTAIFGGLAARHFRMLKPFIILGFVMEVLAIGLMIRFRRSTNTQGELAVVQLLRGAANGFIPFPTQSLIQAAAPHEHLGAITAGWLVVYYLSGGIGSAIGGAMWTNIVPDKLEEYLNGNNTLIQLAYSSPFEYAKLYPPGTPERAAIARAQDEAQRVIVIVGLCIAILALLSSIFLIDNYKLTDNQSLEESERNPQLAAEKREQEGVQPKRWYNIL